MKSVLTAHLQIDAANANLDSTLMKIIYAQSVSLDAQTAHKINSVINACLPFLFSKLIVLNVQITATLAKFSSLAYSHPKKLMNMFPVVSAKRDSMRLKIATEQSGVIPVFHHVMNAIIQHSVLSV